MASRKRIFAAKSFPPSEDKRPGTFSITTHRGCFGGCSFCAISQHQGKIIQSRSERSIILEISRLVAMPWFKGSVSDVGGATANMYGLSCGKPSSVDACRRESCLYPQICRHLNFSGKRAAALLRKVRAVKGVKHVAVSSGVRYDLQDKQRDYFDELLERIREIRASERRFTRAAARGPAQRAGARARPFRGRGPRVAASR